MSRSVGRVSRRGDVGGSHAVTHFQLDGDRSTVEDTTLYSRLASCSFLQWQFLHVSLFALARSVPFHLCHPIVIPRRTKSLAGTSRALIGAGSSLSRSPLPSSVWRCCSAAAPM